MSRAGSAPPAKAQKTSISNETRAASVCFTSVSKRVPSVEGTNS